MWGSVVCLIIIIIINYLLISLCLIPAIMSSYVMACTTHTLYYPFVSVHADLLFYVSVYSYDIVHFNEMIINYCFEL